MNSPDYQWRELASGQRLAVATLPGAECSAVSIHIPAGSRDEADYPCGIAHFLEHMCFKGTATHDARALSLRIESAGGQINACTSEDQTVYDGRGDADLMPLLCETLSDMVWRSTLPEKEIPLECDVIGEEITMVRETPADHIGDMLSAAMWPGHPLGQPISGTLESIAAVDRDSLARFRDAHHFRQDVVIAAAGPYTLEAVAAMLDGLVPEAAANPPMRARFHAAAVSPRQLRETRETDQLQLALAWRTPGRHSEERHALRLLSLMLGETASSRLFLDLREDRGLCYQISSDVTLFEEVGAFEIHVGLDPEAREAALECIFMHLSDLAKNGPQPGELERAKRLAITQGKLSLETTASHACWAGESLMDYDRIPTIEEWRGRILNVTEKCIFNLCKSLFINGEHAIAEIDSA
ncbi:MAG: M16 family metallopeptidase [Luteolibacter sp.]